MRHFLVFRPVTALTCSVGMTAFPAALVATAGRTNGGASCFSRTLAAAIALATIAVATDDHGHVTAHTKIVSSGNFHRQRRPMGEDSSARFVKYSACDVVRQVSGARHRNWLGRWRRCRAGISTGKMLFYRIDPADATTRLKMGIQPCRTAFARRQFAAQTARRKPCGQPTKTTIDKLKRQNQNRCLSSECRRQIFTLIECR